MNPIQTIREALELGAHTSPYLCVENGVAREACQKALAALAELEKQEPVLAMREPSLGGILFAVEQAVKNGCCPFEIEVAFDAYAAECQAELATQRRYASVHEHPPCKGISCGITSSAQKHSPECLAEAAFHQGWSDHDGLDLHVYASLVKKYTAPAAQQPQARTDFTDEWTGYLKDGETPFERFLRERKDLDALTKLYQRALEENERLKAQQPQAECRSDGRCQYAIDHGAEGLGHCPKGKCVLPEQPQAEAAEVFYCKACGCAMQMPHDDCLACERGETQQAETAPPGVVVDRGFRWDGEKQQHIPRLIIEFEPVPANSPCDAQGWRDRDQVAGMFAAAPKGQP